MIRIRKVSKMDNVYDLFFTREYITIFILSRSTLGPNLELLLEFNSRIKLIYFESPFQELIIPSSYRYQIISNGF